MKNITAESTEYSYLLENSPVSYLKLNKKTVIEGCNIAAAKMLGSEMNDLTGKLFREFISPVYLDLFDIFWEKITMENTIKEHHFPSTFSEQFKIEKSDKSIQYCRVQCYVHFCPSNRETHYFISITDLSETRNLLQKNNFQSAVLDSTVEAIVVTDMNGKILMWNKSAEKIFEYKLQEAIGKNILTVFPIDKFGEFYKLIAKIKNGESVVRYETQLIAKDGDARYISLSLSPVKNEKGDTIAVISVFYDISREKQAEIALEKWGNIFRNIESGVCVVNSHDLTFDMVNPAFAEMYGYDSDFLIGTPFSIVSEVPDGKEIANTFSQAQKLGSQSYEAIHKRKSGVSFPVSVDISFVEDKYKTSNFLVVSIQDLTEKYTTEQKLREYDTLARKSEIIKSAFLSNISHEIRTPMNSILGFANLLHNDNLLPEKRRKFVQIINSSSQVLLNIINDIIDISKIEAGDFRVEPTEYPLNLLLLEIYTYYGTNGKVNNKQNINLLMSKVLNNDESKAVIDVKRVKQIFNYLMLNAIKFTTNGFIEFGYRLKKAKEVKRNFSEQHINDDAILIEFYVKDTGIGIAKNSQIIIFERFMQVDNSLTRKHGGAGIGLTISKAYAHLLGGDIWVESEVGEGSTFYFTVPYQPVTEIIKMSDELREEKLFDRELNERCVLIVEDDFASKTYFDEVLLSTGLKLLFANNGQEAIDMVKLVKNIHLIMMDIQLPIMNGLDATREIKKIRPEIPIIAQTAHALDNDRKRSIEAGCVDYISKPFLPNDLIQLIRKHIL